MDLKKKLNRYLPILLMELMIILNFFSVGIDYWLLGAEFEKWTPEDSISIYLYTVFLLADGHKDAILSEYFNSKLKNEELVEQIFPVNQKYELDISTPIITDDELKEAGFYYERHSDNNQDKSNQKFFDFIERSIDEDLKFVREIINTYTSKEGASNCWAVSGEFTKSGKPILVNDPHLGPSMPSPLYMAELNVKDEYVIGALLPGVPLFISLKTNNVSVAVTSLNDDIIDLFEETIKENSYLTKGEWKPITIQEELIKVKGLSEPVKMVVRSTHHGPLLDYFSDIYYHADSSYPPIQLKHDISFSWVPAFTDKNSVLNFMPKIFEIKTVYDVIKVGKGKPDSNFGMCIADSSNNIGWMASTSYPIRPKVEVGRHRIKNGASGEDDWMGLVASEDIPHLINPKKGYVFSTNGRVSSFNTKYGIGAHQPSNGRAIRINQLLNNLINVEKKKIDANDMKNILSDVYDVFASIKTPLLIKIVEKDNLLDTHISDKNILKKVKEWIDNLKKWDFRFEYDSKESTIFSLWDFYIVDSLLQSQISNAILRRFPSKSYGYEDFIIKFLQNLSNNQSHFSEYCNNTQSPSRTCDKMVADGIIFAYSYLKSKSSSLSDENLKYKYWHNIVYRYAPFSSTFLKFFFDRSDIDNGSKNTLNVGSIFYSDFEEKGLQSQHTSVYRMIVDFGKDKDCQYSIDTGVSENLLGNYFYFNQHESHTSFKMFPMGFNSINTTQTQRFGTLRLIYKNWFNEEEERLLKLEQKKLKEEKEKKEDL